MLLTDVINELGPTVQPQGRQYLCWPDGADISITDLASMSAEGSLTQHISLPRTLAFFVSHFNSHFLISISLLVCPAPDSPPSKQSAHSRKDRNGFKSHPHLVTSVLWTSQRRLLANRTPSSGYQPPVLDLVVFLAGSLFWTANLSEFSVLAFSAKSAHDFVLPSPLPHPPPDMTCSAHPPDPAGDAGILVSGLLRTFAPV